MTCSQIWLIASGEDHNFFIKKNPNYKGQLSHFSLSAPGDLGACKVMESLVRLVGIAL